jgi:peptidoglycan/xylan/chitin deacetylase (PgdA/CDA1 family)
VSLEQAAQRVKRNGADIEKYFILGEAGRILVKGDVRQGTSDYEVSYDLENAEVLSDSVYRVPFLIREKESKEPEILIEDTLIWRPGPGRAGLLLALDDDYMETWERYLDFFDEYGARITFFILGGYTPFSVKALSRGHDVGYHTLNHLDLRRVSTEVFTKEAIETAESFRKEGIPLSSLAYPYGFSEPWMHDVLLESYSVLRGYGTTFRIYREDEIRSGYIISRAIDNTVIQGDDNFDRLISLMLRAVKFLDDDRVLPLTTHDISDAHWAITWRRLEFLLKTTVDLHLKFYLYSDFAR